MAPEMLRRLALSCTSTNDHGAAVAMHGHTTAAGKSDFPAVTTLDLTLRLPCSVRHQIIKLGLVYKAQVAGAVGWAKADTNELVQRLQTVLCAAETRMPGPWRTVQSLV